MKTNPPVTLRLALLLGLLVVSTALAIEAGSFAYTKRVETNVLSEPRALAPSTGKLGFRRKVKVDKVQGAWLHVSDGPVGGWVFSGNLADTMPAEIKGADGNPLLAGATTATASNRPLSEEAEAYASQRNLGAARNDLNWLQLQCKSITDANVTSFLQAQKKGEFQ
jgi:hypothetical protein